MIAWSMVVWALLGAPTLDEALLGDALLASLNQCRALHAENRTLALGRFEAVEREDTDVARRWRVRGASGPGLAAVERRRVAVDAAASLAAPERLAELRAALAEWGRAAPLAPRVSDRRGNTFAWVARAPRELVCVIHRPEQDELERVAIAAAALSDPGSPAAPEPGHPGG